MHNDPAPAEDTLFEDQYNARRLGNWEYPKWYPDRPRKRTKPTKIIANDNGHLLEGVKKENPWGNYLGTWNLPRRITREFAEKLAAPPERASRWQKKEAVAREEKAAVEALQKEQEREPCSKCPESQESVSKTSSDEVVECGESPSCSNCGTTPCLCQGKD